LRIKEQETRLTPHEYDDYDDTVYITVNNQKHGLFEGNVLEFAW